MRALACAFLLDISSPLRSLSPQRHPPPPNTGSAAALPPSVAGSLLVGARARGKTAVLGQSVSQLFHGPTPRSPLRLSNYLGSKWGCKCTRSHVCCLPSSQSGSAARPF